MAILYSVYQQQLQKLIAIVLSYLAILLAAHYSVVLAGTRRRKSTVNRDNIPLMQLPATLAAHLPIDTHKPFRNSLFRHCPGLYRPRQFHKLAKANHVVTNLYINLG